MREYMSNIKKEMETKNQKETVEIKSTVQEMKNVLYGFLSRTDTIRERISGLEDRPMGTSKTKSKGEKTEKGKEQNRLNTNFETI